MDYDALWVVADRARARLVRDGQWRFAKPATPGMVRWALGE